MFEIVEAPTGTMSLEERAQNTLLRLLMGEEVQTDPNVLRVVVSLACSDSPPRSPKLGQTYAQVALGSSLVDRVMAVLQLDALDEVDLLDFISALRAESEEPPPILLLRSIFSHSACTDRVKMRLILRHVRKNTSRTNPTAWHFFTEYSGPYARAAAFIASLLPSSPNIALQERLSLELGEMGVEGFELFHALVNDRQKEASSPSAVTSGELVEILATVRNLMESDG